MYAQSETLVTQATPNKFEESGVKCENSST